MLFASNRFLRKNNWILDYTVKFSTMFSTVSAKRAEYSVSFKLKLVQIFKGFSSIWLSCSSDYNIDYFNDFSEQDQFMKEPFVIFIEAFYYGLNMLRWKCEIGKSIMLAIFGTVLSQYCRVLISFGTSILTWKNNLEILQVWWSFF